QPPKPSSSGCLGCDAPAQRRTQGTNLPEERLWMHHPKEERHARKREPCADEQPRHRFIVATDSEGVERRLAAKRVSQQPRAEQCESPVDHGFRDGLLNVANGANVTVDKELLMLQPVAAADGSVLNGNE